MFARAMTSSFVRRLEAGGLGQMLFLGYAARRQRDRLRDLDDAILRDIGLSRAEAEAEADRPFWDVPRGWLRD